MCQYMRRSHTYSPPCVVELQKPRSHASTCCMSIKLLDIALEMSCHPILRISAIHTICEVGQSHRHVDSPSLRVPKGTDCTVCTALAALMGTPSAGKIFLESLTGSGIEGIDLRDAQNFDSVALHSIYDITAYSGGRLTCKIRVDPAVQNRYHTLHGGCIGEPA